MTATPEQRARETIDALLVKAGWLLQDMAEFNRNAAEGVAVREFQLLTGPCDYLLFVGGKAAGVIEAKKAGLTLSGVSDQSDRYAKPGLSLEDLRAIPIALVPLREQKAICELVGVELNRLSNAVREADATGRAANLLRQSVLHTGFSGKLVSHDSADETASDLLARIAATPSQVDVGTKRNPKKHAP